VVAEQEFAGKLGVAQEIFGLEQAENFINDAHPLMRNPLPLADAFNLDLYGDRASSTVRQVETGRSANRCMKRAAVVSRPLSAV